MFLTKAVPLPDFSASSMFSESNIKEDNRMPYHFFSKAKAFCCIIENCFYRNIFSDCSPLSAVISMV